MMSMIRNGTRFGWVLPAVIALGVGLFGCSELREEITAPVEAGKRDCVGCHTDQQILTALATPDTVTVENPGEG